MCYGSGGGNELTNRSRKSAERLALPPLGAVVGACLTALTLTGISPAWADEVPAVAPQVSPESSAKGSIDSQPPAVLSFTRLTPLQQETDSDTLVFQVAFDEDVQSPSVTDFTVDGTTTALVSAIFPVSGAVYDVLVAGGDLAVFDGSVGLNLSPAQAIVDLAGNPLPGGEPPIDEIFVVANDVTVTVEQATSQPDPARLVPISFTATFSEPVTGLESADVILGGTAGATSVSVSGSGTTYNLAVSGMTGEGTVIVSLPAGAAEDAGGKLSLASTSVDNTVTFDAVRPTLLSFLRFAPPGPLTDEDVLVFRAVFDEDIVAPTAADFAVDGGTLAQVNAVVAVSPAIYELTVSGGDLADFRGPVGIDLRAAQTIVDPAGNTLPTVEPQVDESYVVSNPGPETDLAISKSDGQESVALGGMLDYVLTVQNNGPASVSGARVLDQLPAELIGASWVCSPGQGASCGASGSGDIDDLVDLLAGSQVVYTLTVTVDAPVQTIIENLASVQPPAGVADPTAANDEARDRTTVEETIFADGFEQPPELNQSAGKRWLPELLLGDPRKDDVLLHHRSAHGGQLRESHRDPSGVWVPGPWKEPGQEP